VPTCSLQDRLGEVRDRVRKNGWEVCVVVNEERIVLGLLRSRELDGDGVQTIERSMRPGPSTFRPNVPIQEMAEYMVEHDLPSSPITTSEGRLVGVLLRDDAVREALRLLELHKAAHREHEHKGAKEEERPDGTHRN